MRRQLFFKLGGLLLTFHLIGIQNNVFASVCFGDVSSVESAFATAFCDVLKNFKRRITVLEVGQAADYTFTFNALYNVVWVALLVDAPATTYVEYIREQNIKNVTLLVPHNVQYETFFTLGRCEHFDVVLIHDISSLLRSAGSKYIDALIKLGDYVFMEASNTQFKNELKKKKIPLVASNGEKKLYLSTKPKTSLDIPRYTQKDKPLNPEPKYFVRSSPTQKFFSKKGLERPTKWVDGINLITFVMLRGAYPEDSSIRKQILSMKKTHPKHNDLVLGNIIIQGEKLIPIDFADSRRDADLHRCISSALRAFKKDNIRQMNPDRWIREYYDSFRSFA